MVGGRWGYVWVFERLGRLGVEFRRGWGRGRGRGEGGKRDAKGTFLGRGGSDGF